MHKNRFAIAAVGAALLFAQRAQGQEVIKPTTTTTTATRLAAPTGLAARQLSDGRILLTWKPVAGAVRYSIWRSVPPSGTTVVSEGQTDTAYYDGDVKAGSYHYYLVAALSAGGGGGMKAGPPPVNATTSATTSTTSTGDASLEIRRLVPNEIGDGVWITVFAPGRAGQRIVLERAVVTTTKLDWQERIRSQLPLRVADSLSGFGDRFTDVPAGTTLRWRAFAIDSAGVRSAPATSSDFIVPQHATTTASATPTTASTTPLGNVVVSMATPVALRVGATASLSGTLGWSALRWVSLDEGVATVDASGTLTARTGGRAQILAIGRATDGSARVTLVQVTVRP